MRFVQFKRVDSNAQGFGVELSAGGSVADLSSVLGVKNTLEFLSGGEAAMEKAKRYELENSHPVIKS